ncbi:LysR family transcriptional regulator [Aminobacter sp. Y103A]|nr:LysR family transcriptional regulator [Aminobacter sp. SS-2016]
MEHLGRKLPSITALRAFDAVCRAGSMNAAARELNVTAGAISRQIKSLEEDLGAPLFRRGNTSVRLTPFGERLRDGIVPAFDRIESVTREARDHNRIGPLTVACLPTFTLLWLLPRLGRFAEFAPKTELRIVSLLSRDIDWENSEIDVVIDVGRWPVRSDLIQTSFMQDTPGLVAAPGYWEKLKAQTPSGRDEEVLASGTYLSIRSRPYLWRTWSASSGHVLPAEPREIWVDHMFLALQAAKSGIGFAPAPKVYVDEDISEGRLIAPLGFVKKPVPYYLAWPRSRSDDRRIRSLIGWLKRENARVI